MDARWWHQGGAAVAQLQRGQELRGRSAWPRSGRRTLVAFSCAPPRASTTRALSITVWASPSGACATDGLIAFNCTPAPLGRRRSPARRFSGISRNAVAIESWAEAVHQCRRVVPSLIFQKAVLAQDVSTAIGGVCAHQPHASQHQSAESAHDQDPSTDRLTLTIGDGSGTDEGALLWR